MPSHHRRPTPHIGDRRTTGRPRTHRSLNPESSAISQEARSMARAPFAYWRPIPSKTDPVIEPIGVILHVDGGNARSLYHWFNGPSGGIESHFHVDRDGHVEQYRDTGQEADANYLGNSFFRNGKRVGFISVETQGYAHGEWTDAQLESIKRILTWVADTHPLVELREAP